MDGGGEGDPLRDGRSQRRERRGRPLARRIGGGGGEEERRKYGDRGRRQKGSSSPQHGGSAISGKRESRAEN